MIIFVFLEKKTNIRTLVLFYFFRPVKMQKSKRSPESNSRKVEAYGTTGKSSPLEPMKVTRREVGIYDVEIKLKFCGVCHSDIHHARNEWNDSNYPMVPGHEMMGIVSDIGGKVTEFKVGDRVAVGNLVNSCRHCSSCHSGNENYCLNGGPSWVYNGRERVPGELGPVGDRTFGGYSEMIVVNKDFVLHVPDNIPLDKGTPLLCAGITVYAPLVQKRIGKGCVVGIAGIGGLGHLGVKMARAMGATVIAITTSKSKIEDVKRLGADDYIYFPDENDLTEFEGTMDLVIDTVPDPHEFGPYFKLLKVGGELCMVGVLRKFSKEMNGKDLTDRNHGLFGSNVGGIPLTKEMLTFCSKHNIVADIEKIDIQDINEAFTRVIKKDIQYRFVIDLASLRK